MFLTIFLKIFGLNMKNSFFFLLVILLNLQFVFSCILILTSNNIFFAIILLAIAAIDTTIGLSFLIKYHNMSQNTSDLVDVNFFLVLYYICILLTSLVFICKLSNSLFMPHLLLEVKPSMNIEVIETIIPPTVVTVETIDLESESSSHSLIYNIFRVSCAISFVGLCITLTVGLIYFSPPHPLACMYYFYHIQERLCTGSFLEQLEWIHYVVYYDYTFSSMNKDILHEMLNWTTANLEVCTDPLYIEQLTKILEKIQHLLL